jgi:methyl-accepting chemotaxis protein
VTAFAPLYCPLSGGFVRRPTTAATDGSRGGPQRVSASSEQTSASTQEIAATAQALAANAEGLQTLVDRFRTG